MSSIRKVVVAGVSAVVLFQSALASAALDASVIVKGMKQGPFKGNSARDIQAETVLQVEHGPTSPREMSSGLASGKRLHEPVVLTMKLDGAATRAQWDSALTQHEVLTSVVVSYFKPATAGGSSETYFRIALKNAAVEKIEVVQPDPKDPSSPKAGLLLRVSLVYEQITTTWTNGGKTAVDTWVAAQ